MEIRMLKRMAINKNCRITAIAINVVTTAVALHAEQIEN